MKLRYSPTSPYVRKVLIVAIETGQTGRIENVPTDVWGPTATIGEQNPLGKVPCLVTDAGMTLFDSPVICEYLDGSHGGQKLFPGPGDGRWRALRQQAIADGILDAAILARLESNRPADKVHQPWIDRQRKAIYRSMDLLEQEADTLSGPLTIGQVAVGCACGYLDLRYAADRWREGRPKLAAWYEGMAKRKSFLDTVPKDAA